MGANRMGKAGRLVALAAVASTLTLGIGLVVPTLRILPAARANAPARLTDRDFWRLSDDASEANGYFRSDNLTSNELGFERVIPELVARTRPGAAYLGVGPEQNFTYIAALRPSIAVIFDIRRGNLLVQLMYKAIFELTTNRADFVSMLFSRPRPPGLSAATPVTDLFAAFAGTVNDEALYERNLGSDHGSTAEGSQAAAVGGRHGWPAPCLPRVLRPRIRDSLFADLLGADDGHGRSR